jgi:hypothetical protein
VQNAQLLDLDGDGLRELVAVLRQSNELGTRMVWLAITMADEQVRPAFGFELKKVMSGGFVEATLDLESKRKGPPVFVFRRGHARGIEPDDYREQRAEDVVPILLPWEDIVQRRYRFERGALSLVDEIRDPTSQQPSSSSSSSSSTRGAPMEERVEMIAPTVEAVLALFKKQRGVPEGQAPARHLTANLLGKRTPEELFVFGTTLVVVGPEVGQGGGYLAYGVPAQSAEDLRHVGVADVTGDGRAEVFVRVRQPLAGAEGVYRGVMLVHQVDVEGRFTRILSVEAFRYQGAKRIANAVSTRRGKLVVSPGKAIGWDETSYPFLDEAVGGVEPLLLPWKHRALVYRLRDGRLVGDSGS